MISEPQNSGAVTVLDQAVEAGIHAGQRLAIPVSRLHAAGLLPVPHGTHCVGATIVADVKAYLATRQPVATWEEERPLYDRLPEDQRKDVKALQSACLYVRRLSTGKGAIKVQPACRKALALYPKFGPLNTFRGKYDAWVKAADWVELVNRSKAGAEWQKGNVGLPDRFLDFVAARMGGYRRGDAGDQAIASIHRQWQTGRNHRGVAEVIPGYEVLADGTPWEKRNVNLLPDGWSSDNLRTQLKKRAKYTKAHKALLHEGIASARSYLPQNHSTREDLRFMEEVQFDDVRCDFRVLDIVTGQVCDLWLLVARDVATGMLLGFGMRPALARDDGSQEHLKLQDMKQLTGWLLETYGLPPYQMTWKIEHGTATLTEAVKAALEEMLGADRINISYSSMIGGRSATGYQEKAIGNSKGKAMLESLNRLMHMMASHFPGQIGAHYGKRPAQLNSLETEAKEIWSTHRVEDREHLAYPLLTIPQARAGLFEIFRLQNQRSDHKMEGFREVVEWFDGQCWQPGHTAPADLTGIRVTKRMETPMERAGWLLAGCDPFTRVSPAIIQAFYAHTQRRRPVEDNGEITFMHEGKKLRFAAPAPEFDLAPETKCLCYFNPDDPRFLTLTDARGGILGTWVRVGLNKHGDQSALAAAMKYSVGALRDAKDRARELAADDIAQLDQMRSHNADFVTVVEPTAPAPAVATSAIAARLATLPRDAKKAERASRNFDDRIEAALRKSVKTT